jgi:hypothetical protein
VITSNISNYICSYNSCIYSNAIGVGSSRLGCFYNAVNFFLFKKRVRFPAGGSRDNSGQRGRVRLKAGVRPARRSEGQPPGGGGEGGGQVVAVGRHHARFCMKLALDSLGFGPEAHS